MNAKHNVNIGGRKVGAGAHCFIIAEAGVNHNGDLGTALALVDAAVEAGADAVKFQTFNADKLVCRNAPCAAYQMRNTGESGTQYEMLRNLELSSDDYGVIKERCSKRSIVFLSTPFDVESVDLLCALGVPAFKIGSGELTNLQLLAHVAGKGRPVIISTGMSVLDEVKTAVDVVRSAGNNEIVLMHCVSNYPALPEEVNLKAMDLLSASIGVPVGYSDHTVGSFVAVAAVAMGACIIEKHFTLSREQAGPDHKASLDPSGLADLVAAIRTVELAIGDGVKKPADSEKEMIKIARRSLVAAREIPAGHRIEPSYIEIKRPGTGLPPSELGKVAGHIARVTIPSGALISMEMLS